MNCHLTLLRMAITKKIKDSKCWEWPGETAIVTNCWWESKSAIIESSMEGLQNTKIELPNDTAIHYWLYIHRNQNQNVEQLSECWTVYFSTIQIARHGRNLVSINEPMDKTTWYTVYIEWNMSQSFKKLKSCHWQQHEWTQGMLW